MLKNITWLSQIVIGGKSQKCISFAKLTNYCRKPRKSLQNNGETDLITKIILLK